MYRAPPLLVGFNVQAYIDSSHAVALGLSEGSMGPYAATVTRVNDDGTVDAKVTPPRGVSFHAPGLKQITFNGETYDAPLCPGSFTTFADALVAHEVAQEKARAGTPGPAGVTAGPTDVAAGVDTAGTGQLGTLGATTQAAGMTAGSAPAGDDHPNIPPADPVPAKLPADTVGTPDGG